MERETWAALALCAMTLTVFLAINFNTVGDTHYYCTAKDTLLSCCTLQCSERGGYKQVNAYGYEDYVCECFDGNETYLNGSIRGVG